MKILAGDVGGTNTRLAYYEADAGRLELLHLARLPSREYANLESIVQTFLSAQKLAVDCACFGIACPVRNGRCEMPNLGWTLNSRDVARALGLPVVWLINDLEASAHGLALLRAGDLFVLKEGEPDPSGNMTIIAAGTGLGEAGLVWDGSARQPFASEGGHADFAPRTRLEVDLLLYLENEFGHVSYERVLSGPGLYNIYRFLRDSGRGEEQPWVGKELANQDPAATISALALANKDRLCSNALDMFISIYAAEAGNLALKMMATGGVYLGGGIAPKIAGRLHSTAFIDSFVGKGRLSAMLQAVPVSIILNDEIALLGAAQFAAKRTRPDRALV